MLSSGKAGSMLSIDLAVRAVLSMGIGKKNYTSRPVLPREAAIPLTGS
jgi:hypothetical protein